MILKDAVKYLLNRARYRSVQWAWGAGASGDCEFGSNVAIGKNSYVFNSKLGNDVKLLEDCAVFDSHLEGNNVLYGRCTLGKARLGAYSYMNTNATVGSIEIGRFCSIGPGFTCGYGIHPTNFVSTSPVFFSTRKQCGTTFADRDLFEEHQLTTVGHDVWVGTNVFLKDGIRVGHGAVLAAGAVVTKDIPSYAIVGGVPAKIIRFRFDDSAIEELLRIEWWHWSEDQLRAAQSMFAREGVEAFLAWNKENHRQTE